MTTPSGTDSRATAGLDAAATEAPPVPRHPGCYWDADRAAWVPYAPLPLPRDSRD